MREKTAAVNKVRFNHACDAAAVLCGFLLFSYFVMTAGRGVGIPDELYHFMIPFRVLHGDAFLVHDWSVQQIAQLINIIPYWIFIKLTGSTEGLLLYARYFFICVDACFYIYMYLKLRRKIGFWAILSTFLFCAILPPTGLCLSYYNIGSMAMIQICLMLFLDTQQKSVKKLILAGFIWGISILAQPMTFLMCILFIIVVFLRFASKGKLFKSCSFIFSMRSLCWLSFGSSMVLALFVSAIFITGGIGSVAVSLPYFLSNDGYSGASLFDFWKIPDAISLYGVPGMLFWLLSLGLALYVVWMQYRTNRVKMRKSKKNKQEKEADHLRFAAFVVSCFGFALCSIWSLRFLIGQRYDLMEKFYLYQNLPLLLFSLVWVLLCEKKETNVFLIWCTGFLFSLFSDVSSDVMLGIGGPVTILAGVMALRSLLAELKRKNMFYPFNAKKKMRSQIWARLAVVCFVLLSAGALLAKGGYIVSERILPVVEYSTEDYSADKMRAQISEGPFKGIVTTEYVKTVYDAVLRDLSLIKKENTQNAPVMVAGICPVAYLYLDFPVGCSNVLFESKDYALQQNYWTIFPQKKPRYIYVSDYSFFTYRNMKTVDKRLDLSRFLSADMEEDVMEVETGRIAKIRS